MGIATVAVAAGLYIAALTAVAGWVRGLARRGVADRGTARDWYLVAAGVGFVAAPLLAFTIVSAFR